MEQMPAARRRYGLTTNFTINYIVAKLFVTPVDVTSKGRNKSKEQGVNVSELYTYLVV